MSNIDARFWARILAQPFHFIGVMAMRKRLLEFAGILFLILNIGVLAEDQFETNDALLSVVYGGEAMTSLVELTKQMNVDGETITKDVESTLEASGVQGAYLETSALLTTIKDGHVYINGIEVYESLKMPTEFDVEMNYDINIDTSLFDPTSPIFKIESSTLVLPETGEPFFMDEFNQELFELSKLEGDEFDQAVMDWFGKFVGIKFGNIGIDHRMGYDIPMSDSHNGVTCRWGESEEIGLRM